MPIIAGNVLSWSCDHTELGAREFECKSGEDATIKRGGYVNRDDSGDITSGGTKIYVKNRMAWSMESTIGANPGDLDYIQSLEESDIEAVWTAQFMDGTVRAGTGQPTSEVSENKQAGTISLKVEGSGFFEEI